MQRRSKWELALAVTALASLIAASLLLPVGDSVDELVRWVRGQGVLGVVALGVATVVLTLTLLPTIELFLGAGLVYGTWAGSLLTTVVTLAAGMLGLWLGRSGMRGKIEKLLEKHDGLAAVDDAIDERSFWIAFLLRLAPVVPFGMLNYALSATKISTRTYIATLLLGMVPGNIALAYIGSLFHSVTELSQGPDGVWKHVMLWGGIAATIAASVLVGQAAKHALERAEHASDRGGAPSRRHAHASHG